MPAKQQRTPCICAIDQGTQSTRVFFFDRDVAVLGSCQAEFEQHTPKSGWTEHDAMEIMDSVRHCIDGALKDAQSNGYELEVLSIGITNQRETTLVWDKSSGEPLHHAIVWHDGRTSAICKRYEEQLGSKDYFRKTTGLPISTYFSAYKYRWLVENVEGIGEAVSKGQCFLGTIDSWLIWNLTGGNNGGVFVTDVSNASRTNFMDLQTQSWHKESMQLFGVQTEMLPEIKSNAEVYGKIADGPLKGVPIAGCIGDQQAALLGQSCAEGEAKNTYGTGCFLLMNTGSACTESSHGLISTVAYQLGKQAQVHYALEGSIAVGGYGIRWLRDNLGVIKSPSESESIAESVPDTAGVYFVPAFSGLLAPHWNESARGAILGITAFTKAAHIVRATLEAIAWQTREVLDAMRDDHDGKQVKTLKVDGGASQNSLLMQIQADALQLPVQRPSMMETTSLGAAFAAGIGIGFWSEEWVLSRNGNGEADATLFNPQQDAEKTASRYQKWQKAVQRTFDLADLAEE